MDYNPERCPVYAPFFGALGTTSSIVLTVLGAAYATARSSPAIFTTGILRPDRLMQNTLCAVMAQVLAVYGVVVGVIITGDLKEKMALYTGMLQFGAGLSVGLCGLAAGIAVGIVGDAGAPIYLGMVLLLIFSEVLALYGAIVSILMLTRARQGGATECRY